MSTPLRSEPPSDDQLAPTNGESDAAVESRDAASSEPSARDVTSSVMVGIPAYNEEVGIGSTVLGAKRFTDRVVVVDDGSGDDTVAIAEQAGAIVLRHEHNLGKGRALRTLFEYAREMDCETLVVLDADGQHEPFEIPTVVAPILSGDADVVVGSRYLEPDATRQTPAYRRFGQRFLDVLTVGRSKTKITDTQSGFRAFSRAAIQELPIRSKGMGVESEMLCAALEREFVVREVPIDVRYEGIDGQTYHPVHHGLSVLISILGLVRERNPLLFYSVSGLVLVLTGLFATVMALAKQDRTGRLSTGRLYVGVVATVLGAIGIVVGVVLHRVAKLVGRRD